MKRAQIERQAERVAEIEAAIAQEVAARVSADSPPAPTEQVEPPVEKATNPTEQTETVSKITGGQPDPVPPVDPEKLPEQDDIWKRRYDSLQGKYNSEVPRLHDSVKELQRQLEAAVDKIEELKQTATQQQKPNEGSTQMIPGITDDDIEAFGPDMIDIINRASRAVAQEATDKLNARLESLQHENERLKGEVSEVTRTQKTTADGALFERLGQAVPNWRTINDDPLFHDWLSEADPFSGIQRQEILINAQKAGDVGRLVNIFNSFLATLPQPKAQSAPNPAVTQQVQPARNRASSPTRHASDDKKVWSTGEIQEFYTDISKGKYVGKETERSNIEKQIDLAVSQGRVAG